jgi:hypothetical protein
MPGEFASQPTIRERVALYTPVRELSVLTHHQRGTIAPDAGAGHSDRWRGRQYIAIFQDEAL